MLFPVFLVHIGHKGYKFIMKRWYVLQVFAGSEEIVQADIERRVAAEEMQELVGRVMVPSAKAKPSFFAPDPTDQHLFPGYVLVELEPVPAAMKFVLSAPRAVRFLGGKDPQSLSAAEVDRIVARVKGEVTMPAREPVFTVGAEVDITEGPFAGFVGIVEKVNPDSEHLTVMVSIFGRLTPVELGFNQVKR